jgi:ribosomal protein S12 methylthiotransferase
MRRVVVTQASHYDLVGELVDPDRPAVPAPAPPAASPRRRVGLRVLQTDGR